MHLVTNPIALDETVNWRSEQRDVDDYNGWNAVAVAVVVVSGCVYARRRRRRRPITDAIQRIATHAFGCYSNWIIIDAHVHSTFHRQQCSAIDAAIPDMCYSDPACFQRGHRDNDMYSRKSATRQTTARRSKCCCLIYGF